MNALRSLPRSLLVTFGFVALLFAVQYYGPSVLAYNVPEPPVPVVYSAPDSLSDREANRFYLDCLARRDAGDMRCGESCFWRECITCANVCTLNCEEPHSCGCSCSPCNPVVAPPVLEAGPAVPEQTGPDDYEDGGTPQREPYEGLGCQSYVECEAKYGPIRVSSTTLETNFSPGTDPSAPGPPYESFRDNLPGDGLTAPTYVVPQQPFSVTGSFAVQNDFLGHGGLDSADADRFTFPCSVRWWDITSGSRAAPPRLVYGQWQGETWYGSSDYGLTCRIGHNENGDAALVELGFYAEPTHCDDPNVATTSVNCPINYALNAVTAPDPGAYRAWPVGTYEVALYVDVPNPTATDVPLAARTFEVQQTPRPNPWPLTQANLGDPERPMDGGNPPPGYTNPGNYSPWPDERRFTCVSRAGYASCNRTNYDVRRLPYDPNVDCYASGLCSEHHPWDYPLPWGFNLNYEIRPVWGDYEPLISPAERTAPFYEVHTGFNFIYPQCPRLDWCYRDPGTMPRLSRRDNVNDRQVVDGSVYGSYTGQYNVAPPTQHGGDPCEADHSECVPTYCDDNFPACAGSCGPCCSPYCTDSRSCAWHASCGACTQWAWRTLGVVGSGRGPRQFGFGMNIHSTDRTYSGSLPCQSDVDGDGIISGDEVTPCDERRYWDVQIPSAWGMSRHQEVRVDLQNFLGRSVYAGDTHLFADEQYGSASRCEDIRGVVTDRLAVDDDGQWGASLFAYDAVASTYSWLSGVRSRLNTRVPFSQRPAVTPAPTRSDPFDRYAYDDRAQRCEAEFREVLAALPFGSSDMAFSVLQPFFDQVRVLPECAGTPLATTPGGLSEGVVPWYPNFSEDFHGCSFRAGGAELPQLSGYYSPQTIRNLWIPQIQAHPSYQAPDYDRDGTVTPAEVQRHADELAFQYRRGYLLVGWDSQMWFSHDLPGDSKHELACSDGGSSDPFALRSCAETGHGSSDSVSLYRLTRLPGGGYLTDALGNLILGMYRVPPLPSDDSICWRYNPADLGWVLQERGPKRLYVPGFPDPVTGVYPTHIEYPQHGSSSHRYEEMWGFVDSRPAPALLLPIPTGVVVDGPPGSVQYANLLRDDMLAQYDWAYPEDRYDHELAFIGPATPICGLPYDGPVTGHDAEGSPFQLEYEKCWVRYRGAVVHVGQVGQLLEEVSNSSPDAPTGFSSISPVRFPLFRHYGMMHSDAMALPNFIGRDPEYTAPGNQPESFGGHVSESFNRSLALASGDGFETSSCPYLSGRGMLRSGFVLEDWLKGAGPDGSVRRLVRRHVTNYLQVSPTVPSDFTYVQWPLLLVQGRHERSRFDHDELVVMHLDDSTTLGHHLFPGEPASVVHPVFHEGVLEYRRPRWAADGTISHFTEERLPWVGYSVAPDGDLTYRSSSGVDFPISRDLYPGCSPACPYLAEDGQPLPDEYIYGLCPVGSEFGAPTRARFGSENCTYFGQYPVSGVNGSWPGRVRNNLVYRSDEPISPHFDRRACYYSVTHGQVRCGIEGYLNRPDDEFLFQDIPYPYCPPIRPGASGYLEPYVIPAVDPLRTVYFRTWNTPSWSSPSPIGRLVLPTGEHAGYSFIRRGRDMVDFRFPFGSALPAFPAPGSRSGSVAGPDGCGVYPSDWTFVADLAGLPEYAHARSVTNLLGIWPQYVDDQWSRRMADTGPFLCELTVTPENEPRYRHFEPSRYDIGSVALERGHGQARIQVRVLMRTTDATGAIVETTGHLDGVYDLSGRLVAPGGVGVTDVMVPAVGGNREDQYILRITDPMELVFTDYRIRLHTY